MSGEPDHEPLEEDADDDDSLLMPLKVSQLPVDHPLKPKNLSHDFLASKSLCRSTSV